MPDLSRMEMYGIIQEVKEYVGIAGYEFNSSVVSPDADREANIRIMGYIKRGMARLQKIAGAPLVFTNQDSVHALLLDYCRYANSQALEVFETNFRAELLELNLSNQAPIISGMAVILGERDSTGCRVTVSPAPGEGNRYMYLLGTSLTLPQRLDSCLPSGGYIAWDGISRIPAASGQDICIVEINDEYEAVRAGKVTVTDGN